MGHRKFISILLTGVISFGITLAKEPAAYAGQSDALETILPGGIAQFYPPIEIKDILYYQDGGTTGIALKDGRGKVLKFCLDGRLQFVEPGKAKPYHIYIGGVYPDNFMTKSIPIGGKEEKSILKLLQAWADEHFSHKEQQRLSSATGLKGLSEKEVRFYRVFKVMNALKNR